jgi:hypothetical protein
MAPRSETTQPAPLIREHFATKKPPGRRVIGRILPVLPSVVLRAGSQIPFFRDAAIGTRTRLDQPAVRIGLQPCRPRRRDNDRLQGSVPIAIASKPCRALQRAAFPSRRCPPHDTPPAGRDWRAVRRHRLTNQRNLRRKQKALSRKRRTDEPRPRHGSSSRRAHACVSCARGHFQHIELRAGARPFCGGLRKTGDIPAAALEA